MPGLAQPHQAASQQRPARQIERAPRLFGRQPPQLRLRGRTAQLGQIDYRQGQSIRRGNPLDRHPVLGGEGGAQHLMPADDRREAALQRPDIQDALQLQPAGNGVGGTRSLQLIQKP